MFYKYFNEDIMSKKRRTTVTFYSKHRKNTVTIPNEDHPDGVEVINFKPLGMIGLFNASPEQAKLLRKHSRFNAVGRGAFQAQGTGKLPKKKKGNIVSGPKGAGTVIKTKDKTKKAKSDKAVVAGTKVKKEKKAKE